MNRNKPTSETQQSVQEFLEAWGERLESNQIELLEFFKENIYGFKLECHDMSRGATCTPRDINEATFKFEHLGVTGEIVVRF